MGTKKESQGGLVDIEHKVSIADTILKYHMHYSIKIPNMHYIEC